MSTSWRDDDEDFKVGGVKGGLRSKPRFSLTEVKMLLDAVKRNRYIILRKFNQGVSAEAKKQTWTEITNQINGLGENHREVRQIMKKWADLKCDGKRRIVALRGPNGNTLRKKNLGPVERMVHKILMMSPRGDGESDPDIDEDDFPKPYSKPYSYLSLTDGPHTLPGGASFELSPLSSPEKEIGDPLHSSSEFDLEMGDDGERTVDFDENDDSSLFSSHPSSSLPPPSSLDPLPDNVLPRVKPVYTYSRNSSSSQNHHNHIQNHNYSRSVASTSSAFPPLSDSDALPPPLSQSAANSGRPVAPAPSSSVAPGDSTATSVPAPPPPPPATSAAVTAAPSSFVSSAAGLPQQPPPPSFSSSSSSVLPPTQPPGPSSSSSSDPLPAGASSSSSSSGRPLDNVVQMASQSLQQQRASRMLLTSVSQSMEVLAQSVQLLVESQQEFVQESLLLQRETVDILRDFSNTALTMLRDKSNSGHLGTHHLPSSHS